MKISLFKTSEFLMAALNFIAALILIFSSKQSSIIRFASFVFSINFILWIYKANLKINGRRT